MPTLTRYFIKTAMIHFGLGMLLAVAIAAQPAMNLPPSINAFRPVYYHLLMVGWVMQLIFGVALWMFPKFSKDQPYGNQKLNWAIYVSLNVGLILRLMGEPLLVLQPDANVGWMLALSALLQLFAGWSFIASVWPRVRER